ncbi:hypothetical protein OPV22_014315 [Ensete ventricosum]|uniref:Uncharacterized protein n=1 Tax=Ensete ventricosum TaxID=4639 RepID=A0AAV8PJK7_ENSVE|nr:hypothetical protein OPV22_014315 [Ensete ventricosum]
MMMSTSVASSGSRTPPVSLKFRDSGLSVLRSPTVGGSAVDCLFLISGGCGRPALFSQVTRTTEGKPMVPPQRRIQFLGDWQSWLQYQFRQIILSLAATCLGCASLPRLGRSGLWGDLPGPRDAIRK